MKTTLKPFLFLTVALLLILTACATKYRDRAVPIFIPYGTNNLAASDWWTNSEPNYTNEVLLWQAFKAMNANFQRLSGQLQGQGAVGAGAYSFSTNTVADSDTNFVVNLLGARYQVIYATNNVAIRHLTNGPGMVTVKIYPNGADRIVALSTNWALANTNYLAITNGQWQVVLTNGSRRVAILEAMCDLVGGSVSQSNVWARLTIGQQ